MIDFYKLKGAYKDREMVHISELYAIWNMGIRKSIWGDQHTCFISRDRLADFGDPAICSCFMIFAISRLVCVVLVEIFTEKKLLKSVLRLINFYVSHPTVAATKIIRNITVFLIFFRIPYTFFFNYKSDLIEEHPATHILIVSRKHICSLRMSWARKLICWPESKFHTSYFIELFFFSEYNQQIEPAYEHLLVVPRNILTPLEQLCFFS